MAKNDASSLGTVDEFLKRCRQSGDAAYGALRSVLERLEDPKSRTQARIFLSDLQKRFPTKEDCDQCFRTYHFQIEDIFFDQYEGLFFSFQHFSSPHRLPVREWKIEQTGISNPKVNNCLIFLCLLV